MSAVIIVAFAALAEEPSDEVPEVAPDRAATEARVRELLAPTQAMSPTERSTFISALLDAGQPEDVQTALIRALAGASTGLDYDHTLALALQTAPPPAEPIESITVHEFDAADLEKMRTYRLQHYSVRTETHVSGGGMEVANPYGMGAPILVPRPVTTLRTWAVYSGPQRLDVPDYLRLADEAGLARDLDSRIKSKTWLSRAYYGVAGIGAASVVVGAIGHATTDDVSHQHRWAGVATAGLGGVVVGLIGGSLPLASATRLRTDYSRATDIHTAQEVVDRENERIRQELGLTPEQALDVENHADVSAHTRVP